MFNWRKAKVLRKVLNCLVLIVKCHIWDYVNVTIYYLHNNQNEFPHAADEWKALLISEKKSIIRQQKKTFVLINNASSEGRKKVKFYIAKFYSHNRRTHETKNYSKRSIQLRVFVSTIVLTKQMGKKWKAKLFNAVFV